MRIVRRIRRHGLALTLVIACSSVGLALGLQNSTLRSACEDRNERDAAVLVAVQVIASDLGADRTTIKPLEDALAPRDCDQLYPTLWPGD